MYVYIICVCLQRHITYCSFVVPGEISKTCFPICFSVDFEPLIWYWVYELNSFKSAIRIIVILSQIVHCSFLSKEEF